MKKRFKILMILVIAISIFTLGCSGEKKVEAPKDVETPKDVEASATIGINEIAELQGKDVGMITPIASTDAMESMIASVLGGEPNQVVYFDRYVDAVTATKTGKIDGVLMPTFVSKYNLKRNDDLKELELDNKYEASIIMAVRSEDQELKGNLDVAIATLKENGILKTIEDEWITNLPIDSEPSKTDIEKIEGAPTVYVGVSGDMAPLDYIAADGMPAGYNVAMLSEMSKLMNVNFEFVSLNSQARFAALSSKKIDIIFCHFAGDNIKFIKELENNNWVGTEPYYQYDGISFLVKK